MGHLHLVAAIFRRRRNLISRSKVTLAYCKIQRALNLVTNHARHCWTGSKATGLMALARLIQGLAAIENQTITTHAAVEIMSPGRGDTMADRSQIGTEIAIDG